MEAIRYNPDIVVIELGTNDAKFHNWTHKDQFVRDYTEMINSFTNLPARPEVYICFPSPLYFAGKDINDTVITRQVIPKIDSVGKDLSIPVIEEIDEQHVAGQCSYGRFRNPRLVTIDASFWRRSSDRFKEFIVFHELGHCYLNRGHLESAFSNGVCVSIMRSGVGDCFDNYHVNTREYYINELFEQEFAR